MGIYECTVNKTRLTISVFKISHQFQEACYVRDSSLKRMRVALGKNIEYAKKRNRVRDEAGYVHNSSLQRIRVA